MGQITYYPGGTQVAEKWDDVTSTVTQFNVDGTVKASRPYTTAEQAAATAAAAQATADGNAIILRGRAQAALTANATFVAAAKPGTAAAQASAAYDQAVTVTKECSALIRLVINQLDSTAGT